MYIPSFRWKKVERAVDIYIYMPVTDFVSGARPLVSTISPNYIHTYTTYIYVWFFPFASRTYRRRLPVTRHCAACASRGIQHAPERSFMCVCDEFVALQLQLLVTHGHNTHVTCTGCSKRTKQRRAYFLFLFFRL